MQTMLKRMPAMMLTKMLTEMMDMVTMKTTQVKKTKTKTVKM